MRTAQPVTPDPAQRGASILSLAKESGAGPLEVEALYDLEFAKLEATATIRSFLSLLVSRKVRNALRQQRPAS